MSNFGSPSRLSQATWLPQRQTQDEVTAWGSSSVDQTIKRLTTGYDVRGLVVSADSFGTATAAKNTVGFSHNGWRQLAQETQGHDGGTARAIVYGYETGAANSNTIRRTSVTYPSGQTIAPVQNYAYTGTHANALSRVSSIRDGSTDIISYAWLGLSNPVDVNYNVPTTHLSFGASADHYAGLDRSGRPITVQWLKGTTAPVKAQYRYDRSSNRQWRYDTAAHAAGVTTEDQWYEYDGLYQVRGFQRGTLVGTYPNFSSLSPVAQNESWNYDAMGNWLGYTNDALSQTRQFNKVNEITSLAGPANAITPLYDPTGNMTTMPAVANWTTAQTLTWDAWNRLVKVSEGSTTIAEYSYDALFRRITKTVGSPGSTATRRFYYNDQWQILEEYVGTATNPEARYWYGLRDLNDIARRQRYSTGTALRDDLYALRETMNVVALVNPSGAVQHRMSYDAFGNTQFLNNAWASAPNAGEWAILFHSHYRDPETGLYQMRFSYYHPSLGVWLSRDPAGESASLNLFSINDNNCVGYLDIFGLIKDVEKCIKIIEEFFKTDADAAAMLQQMDERAKKGKSRCKRPSIICDPCCKKIKMGNGEEKVPGGFANPIGGSITICLNNDPGKGRIKEVAKHELIHAYDICNGFDLSKCTHRVCTELRAYRFMSSGTQSKETLKKSVRNSVGADPECLKTYKADFEEAWIKCSPNATTPVYDPNTVPK